MPNCQSVKTNHPNHPHRRRASHRAPEEISESARFHAENTFCILQIQKKRRCHCPPVLPEVPGEGKGYGSLSDFRGKMSQAKSSNPAAYERVQFMKYFGGKN